MSPEDEDAWAALRAGWPEAENLAPVPWHDVAVANNHTPHRLMQWFQTCSAASRQPGMAGIDQPFEGDLTKEMVGSLFEILTDHSGRILSLPPYAEPLGRLTRWYICVDPCNVPV